MKRASTVRLPVALAVVVVAALAAVMTGRPEVAVFAAPWAALLALGVTAARPRRMQAGVEPVSDRVVAGDDVRLEVAVAVDGPGWVMVTPQPLTDGWAVGGTAEGSSAPPVVAAVDGDRPAVLSVGLPPPSWGTHDVGRVELVLGEPYGLFEWTGAVVEPRWVRVHPRPVEMRHLLPPALVRRLTGVHPSVAVDRGVEFADIRPFGPGDALRDVNWRASARSDGLLVSQRHPDRSTEAILLLDSFVEAGHDVHTTVGLAVSAALALAEAHLGASDRVGVVELGGVVRWVVPGTGRAQLQRLVDALLGTRLYANATERDLTIIPPRALPPRSFILALSPLLDPRFVDALFLLRAHGHDVAVIDCHQPWPVPDPTAGEWGPAAALLFEAEREVTLGRLAERSIAVGQWQPGVDLDAVLAGLARRRRRARMAGR